MILVILVIAFALELVKRHLDLYKTDKTFLQTKHHDFKRVHWCFKEKVQKT